MFVGGTLLVSCAFGVSLKTVAQDELRAVARGALQESFVADEANLRKLGEIVRKRIAEQAGSFRITYVVELADGSLYSTTNPDVVFKEENLASRRVVSISVTARPSKEPVPLGAAPAQVQELTEGPVINVSLKNGAMTYYVHGPQREWVFITQSDIRERLANMSGRTRQIKFALAVALGLGAWALTFFVPTLRWRRIFDERMRQRNPDHGKTPFRRWLFGLRPDELQVYTPRAPMQMSWLFCWMFGGAIGAWVGYQVGSYLFPDAVFAIGQQLQAYEDLKTLRTTLLWGLVVAFVVGVAASALANQLVRRRPPA